LKVDSANALEGADEKGILGEEVSWIGTLHLTLKETWVGFLQKFYLFFGEVYVLAALLSMGN
jgi:hypothetical protein